MYTARRKIQKEKNAEPTEFELQVAQALFDLEVNATDLKGDLKELFISGARQVDLGAGKTAILVFVPFRLLKGFHKVQARLVRELEKKFSGQHVVVIANRRILPVIGKKNRRKRQKRPMSRTLTAVHDAILEDLVYPTEITGKRIRIRLDGSRLYKVYDVCSSPAHPHIIHFPNCRALTRPPFSLRYLDKKDQNNVEYKLDTFARLYKKLTGKQVAFLF